MHVITLCQPWASLWCKAVKQYETRSWPTRIRGPLLIHAAKRPPLKGMKELEQQVKKESAGELMPEIWQALDAAIGDYEAISYLPTGAVVGFIDLTDCRQMVEGDAVDNEVIAIATVHKIERAAGFWQPGRYAWRGMNMRRFDQPIPWRGQQGIRRCQKELRSLIQVTALSCYSTKDHSEFEAIAIYR